MKGLILMKDGIGQRNQNNNRLLIFPELEAGSEEGVSGRLRREST